MDNFAKLVAVALLGLAPLANANAANGVVTFPFETFVQHQLPTSRGTAVSFAVYPIDGASSSAVRASAPTALGGTSGWSMASNFGTKVTASGGIDLATSGSVNVGKHSVPVTLTGTASKAATLAGMRTAFMGIARAGAGPLGALFLVPAFVDWVAAAGVQRNPDHTNTEKPFLKEEQSADVCWKSPYGNQCFGSAQQACNTPDTGVPSGFYTAVRINDDYYSCRKNGSGAFSVNRILNGSIKHVPASWDELTQKWVNANFGAATLPKFIDETERLRKEFPKAGIEPFKVDLQYEKATGPATLPGVAPTITTTTKVNPDGSTTVTTTTKTNTPTVEYTDNTVKVTDKEVTKTEEKTCTQTATCTTTKPLPDEETQKPAEEETDLCKLHPDILACLKVTKAGELEPVDIPNADKTMQIVPDQGWGPSGGTCPAPKTATIMGVNLVMPFTLLCDFATAIRPLLIAFAWLSAALTFFGLGRKD